MANPLLSSYKQGENRITASIMAVFERLNFSVVESILQAVLETPEQSLLGFDLQPSGKGSTIPDARIHANFSLWFETKTTPNSVNKEQLEGHLKHFDSREVYGESEKLIVLTPDGSEPLAIGEIDDQRIVWVAFSSLDNAIEGARTSKDLLLSERELFLLRELQNMLEIEGLIPTASDQVLIVPAREAYETYLKYSVYICQPNRTFRKVPQLGFYKDGEIKPEIPSILDAIESVAINHNGVAALDETTSSDLRERLAELINQLLVSKWFEEGQIRKILFLSPADSDQTVKLPNPIKNDLKTKNGDTAAWVQKQRYANLESLKSSNWTSELE